MITIDNSKSWKIARFLLKFNKVASLLSLLSIYEWEKVIKKSDLFNAEYYLLSYQDIKDAELEPLSHYVRHGWKEGRNPSNEFNTSFYLKQYEDVRESGVNPLVHFIIYGKEEGRVKNADELNVQIINGSQLFNTAYYLSSYTDVNEAGIDPVWHFVQHGWKEERNPSSEFNTSFYQKYYEDVRESGINPLVHYILNGIEEGRLKNSVELNIQIIEGSELFNKKYYLSAYRDVKEAGLDPVKQYVQHGWKEGKNPSIKFDTKFYLSAHEDVRDAEINPLSHYIQFGRKEKREIKAVTDRASLISCFEIIPHYIDPIACQISNRNSDNYSIAIHIHLYYEDMVSEFLSRLNFLGIHFDLYVSVTENVDIDRIESTFKTNLPDLNRIFVESVPNRGRDIAPFIIQFGKRLMGYEVIGHFHTKKSPHNTNLENWFSNSLDLMLGVPGNNGQHIQSICSLLRGDAKIVYPEGTTSIIKDPSGWADNKLLAKEILDQYTSLSIDEFPIVEFPEGAFFWAQSEALSKYLSLPLTYTDFPIEPIKADGTIAHALERLILIFAGEHPGRCYRIHKSDSITDYRHYEEQQDFSDSIVADDIKVLSYYLPQFHPIPENDEWHGEGFTEWTKVRGASPLFVGHYQQHIPHGDIGYYLLDTPEILEKQAEMMRLSGVHGQIFYHYWFSGKLILEEPAKMLLNNQYIDMPFCFCWANENWTRRWDGNEDEVLLGQTYSEDDARDFIHYLIPFIKDSRYICIEDRPVLFIYRPSSIPDAKLYIDIWAEECRMADIPSLYIVAVLTRGATNPEKFHMDAGVERILHDWTNGHVPEINNTLSTYHNFDGSVLPYDKVAEYYETNIDEKGFTYFRSITPIWDNTARYAEKAYLIHGSTPYRFQSWLEKSVEYTKKYLPDDRRYIVINAWNEWAEGAHLEPDSRYGYSYLNSIGRALSNVGYDSELNASRSIPENLRVHISIHEFMAQQILSDTELKARFISDLSRSTFLDKCIVSADDEFILYEIPSIVDDSKDNAHIVLQFRRISLFGPTVIEKMLSTNCRFPGSIVIVNGYAQSTELYNMTKNGSIDSAAVHNAPIVLLPINVEKEGLRNIRIRTDARCYVTHPCVKNISNLPHVTTIVRFHARGHFNELQNALYCLASMANCVVTPLIAVQDLDKSQLKQLEKLLEEIPFSYGISPEVVCYYSSDGKHDMRSTMLNKSLKNVKTRYGAFLDYDDLLFPDAYSWLIDRLNRTEKAVTFGRVYDTKYDCKVEMLLERGNYFEYNTSYGEYLNHNHAPIHSFMLDLDQLDVSQIIYHKDQKYMEDYFLTLQLITRDNTDWDSLLENVYIGDYIHNVNRVHTLAISDEEERKALLSDLQYQKDEARINSLRQKIIQSGQ